MKRFWAKIEDKVEEFDELPVYQTYFMYGQDGKEYIGNAMLLYMGCRLTPIYESKTGKVYKRPEYAGMDLKDIDNFEP